MADYSFLTIWKFDAPIDRMWDAIYDVTRYPEWWKYVARVERIKPGDEHGVGESGRMEWKTALPYRLSFETRATRVEPPHVLESVATGELEGNGRWELSEDAGGTTVRYEWHVRTTKPWMRFLDPIARPAFVWNHDVLMSEGGEALARRLNARLLQNENSVVDNADRSAIVPLLIGAVFGAGVVKIVHRSLRRT